jgi:hypothetical protein
MKRLLPVAAFAALTLAIAGKADAVPPFAQSYGIDCNTCHSQVPALNAYGRYVQRTGYASLDPHVLRRAFPLWVGEQLNYDSTSTTMRPQPGNIAVHAIGAIGNDFTYHAQQWIWSNNGAGDLDTLWLAYNNVLHRDGHIFLGKIESPGPSTFSMWTDIAPFNTPEMTVGEHVYQLDANRWGAKLNYIHGNLDSEAGWMYDNTGWNGSSNFINSDKTFVYKIAYANPVQPMEVGYLGSRGSVPVSTGIDQYSSWGGYVERDPTGNVPGVFMLYLRGHDLAPGADPNTGNPLGPATGSGFTGEVYQTFFRQRLFISGRKEWGNDGMGNAMQSGSVDMSYRFAKYLRGYTEVYMTQNATPAWRYYLWWTVPIEHAAHD